MNNRRTLYVVSAIAFSLWMNSCRATVPGVVAYTSVDQVFSEPVFREFEKQSDRQEAREILISRCTPGAVGQAARFDLSGDSV